MALGTRLWQQFRFTMLMGGLLGGANACKEPGQPKSDPVLEFARQLKNPLQEKPEPLTERDDESTKPTPLSLKRVKAGGVYLYAAGPVPGDFGGRAGANRLCRQRLSQVSSSHRVAAFISVKDNDHIFSFASRFQLPVDQPVYSLPTADLLAKRWQDLYVDWPNKKAPRLLKSMAKARIVEDDKNRFSRDQGLFWSGSYRSPQADRRGLGEHHCGHWTSRKLWGSVAGVHGPVRPDKTEREYGGMDFPWYDYQMVFPCRTPRFLLCVVWQVPPKAPGRSVPSVPEAD